MINLGSPAVLLLWKANVSTSVSEANIVIVKNSALIFSEYSKSTAIMEQLYLVI